MPGFREQFSVAMGVPKEHQADAGASGSQAVGFGCARQDHKFQRLNDHGCCTCDHSRTCAAGWRSTLEKDAAQPQMKSWSRDAAMSSQWRSGATVTGIPRIDWTPADLKLLKGSGSKFHGADSAWYIKHCVRCTTALVCLLTPAKLRSPAPCCQAPRALLP